MQRNLVVPAIFTTLIGLLQRGQRVAVIFCRSGCVTGFGTACIVAGRLIIGGVAAMRCTFNGLVLLLQQDISVYLNY